jgi:hypothetical protein
MNNWIERVRNHHNWAHKDDNFELVMQPPVRDEDIAVVAQRLGFPLTEEFREFYSQVNGFGVTADGKNVSWFLVPIDRIEATIADARDWFGKTHPEWARRFFPFVDWDSGDYTGYLLGEDGSLLPGLYDFDHENYKFEEGQAIDGFLTQGDSSVFEFVNVE